MSLTPKQERFAQCIVSGMSGKDSYYTAYDTTCNEQVAYNEAMKLLNHEGVQERIKELRKPLELHAQTAALTETERIKQILWEEIENARTQQDHAAIARYTDQLNKLNNAYKDASAPQDNTSDLNNIDTNTLNKIAKFA
jgi:flagellin-specific chaperone FliS